MNLTIYSLKNRMSGIFERPFVEIYDVNEYPELLRQSLAQAPVVDLERHKEFDLYCLGSFDSILGEIKSISPDFVVSLDNICNQYIAQKSEIKDVGSKEVA